MKHDVLREKGRKSTSSVRNINSSRSNSHCVKFGNLSCYPPLPRRVCTLRLHELAYEQMRGPEPIDLVRRAYVLARDASDVHLAEVARAVREGHSSV